PAGAKPAPVQSWLLRQHPLIDDHWLATARSRGRRCGNTVPTPYANLLVGHMLWLPLARVAYCVLRARAHATRNLQPGIPTSMTNKPLGRDISHRSLIRRQ